MLGWMLKRGDNAPDADAGDTTQLDPPDTPAPVFAARAFRSALFGTPAPANVESRSSQDKMAARTGSAASERGCGTPSKPPGILLTPGTGTSRRKRVSFGHDVARTTKAGSKNETASTKDGSNIRPTRVAEALENSRERGSKKVDTRPAAANNSEDEWEEEDDDFCAHDITLDLNEPHSQSGRYWKEEFEKYHQEAKAEMEKLLKYKQLAKSYAQQKDAEAIQLTERLRDEQQRVIKMEKRIAQNASQIVLKHGQSSDDEPTELLSKLTKQTTLADQYRRRVKELEDELDAFLRQKGGDGDARGQRRRQTAASPTTQKTAVETQRELRRARTQLKELDSLRREISSLKARVQVAEAQAIRAKTDDVGSTGGGSRARDLRAQLQQAKEESRKKDEEMLQLKSDFEAFRKESEVHEADTKAVLERAHAKISDLKKEIKTLKATGSDGARPNSWHAESEAGQEEGSGAKADGPTKQSSIARGLGRRTFVSVDDGGLVRDASAPDPQSRSLREKFLEDADFESKAAPSALTERPSLDKPRWQPFVPRSPRNRAYLGEDLERRIRNGGATPAATKMESLAAPDLRALAEAVSRKGKPEKSRRNVVEVDLLQDRFARLGGPDANLNGNKINSSMVGNTSKSTMPPERRAAALARIEQRMAEKKRWQRRKGHDKENVRP
ncbi:Uncharacterized protein TCAP_02332 [Tolypocladium capitatum]|uniref:Spindle pole body-associated protein cut12 domain-containing protein n=1 Tax=Tolypocladium capitatum TaxID=45235 RepID=A0A2K3QJJ4_9HYPO|nr:Uncharacterized protein TCAP_02332 [Tolypocladium capitatum]